jgi:hypothetical protein
VSPRRWTFKICPECGWETVGHVPYDLCCSVAPHKKTRKMVYVPVREDIITEEDIEAVASELALIDDYNPNDLTPAGWTTVRDGYQEKARRVLMPVLGSDKEDEDA